MVGVSWHISAILLEGPWDCDLQNDTVTRTPRHDEIFRYPDLLPTWKGSIRECGVFASERADER